jgi:hypothetical protein
VAILETLLLGLAANGVYDLTKEAAVRTFSSIKQSRPDLIEAAENAARTKDDDALRHALAGAIEVAAATGHVKIEGAFLSAVREAQFDHQQGTIIIGGTRVNAPILVTGGGAGATGNTIIDGDTVLSSSGTSIEVGRGASITMTGGASIKQT